jgi:hypothetical protein
LNSFKVYKSIREIPESEWIHFVPTSRYFLSYQYLSTLEKSSPELDYIYVLYYKNNILKGLVSFQVVDFKGDALRKYIPDTNFLVKFILNKGLDCIQSKLLVLGNLIFTCETGWYFDPLFSEPHRDKILFEMIRIARKQVPKNTIGIMINEASGIRQHHSYKCQGFHLFEVENKMVFKSRLFSNFSEYDEKLISKYRVRKNKIFQLNKNIEFFEINVLNFEMYQNEIQDLFNNVIEKSKFKLLDLNKDYFKIFLEEQSQTFKLVGFRENNTLLGFVSYFEINQEIEVHYIGLNYNYNQTNKLYNLMLYKMIELGISENKIEVCMSRTAQEIKSSVGAQPIRVFSFLKITNVFLNFLTPFFLGRLKPKKWSPRSIFK